MSGTGAYRDCSWTQRSSHGRWLKRRG
jgi:hypothetical protein